MEGWIKTHRSIQQHYLWQDKPFSKGQAWLDILLLANHKDNKFILGNEVVEVERGSFITSEIKLMNRWGWSKSKVRGFLQLLQNDSMVVKKTDRKKTTLKVLNYNVWQDSETTEEPIKDHKKTTKKPQKDTNKNVKNEKNEDNKKHIHGEFKKVLLTDEQFEKLKEDYANYNELIKFLDEYIEMKGYKAKNHYLAIKKWVVDAVKEQKQKANKQEIATKNSGYKVNCKQREYTADDFEQYYYKVTE